MGYYLEIYGMMGSCSRKPKLSDRRIPEKGLAQGLKPSQGQLTSWRIMNVYQTHSWVEVAPVMAISLRKKESESML